MNHFVSQFSLIGFWIVCVVPLAALGETTQPQEDKPQNAPLQYNDDIRPLLAENCFACHGADSASRKADLRLDQREAALDYGAIVPGEPGDSELIARINAEDSDLRMPPPETKKVLTDSQKEILTRWIKEGAEYQPHWSLMVPKAAPPPKVQHEAWVRNAIDRFVLAKLEATGLTPAPEAEPHVIFRRVHLDITGLPPSPEDVAKFSQQYSQYKDLALSDWIDRLMNSPAWGEHRARYWLDAARYADTHGLHFDNYREMWIYRDWVVRMFNANQPFDQFTLEQLAGDLLVAPTTDQLIATGFQRCNITTNEGGTIEEENLAIYATDRVQTLGWVFLGLTTNCAQCHDHKFDAFTMKDHYSLAAFFRNTTQTALDGNAKDGNGPVISVPSDMDRPRWNQLHEELADAKKQRTDIGQRAEQDFNRWLASSSVDTVDAELGSEGLIVHLPLNDPSQAEMDRDNELAQQLKSTGKITWIPDGKLGPAPVMKTGATFELGSLGDFEKNQAFSFGAWVRTETSGSQASILAKMDSDHGFRGWDLWQNGASFAVHLIDSWPDNALKVKTKTDVVTPGKWQHVLASYDGSGTAAGIRIFVDGVAVESEILTETLKSDGSIRTHSPLRIGQRSQGDVFQGGAIQDVRIYERGLADAEIESIVEATTIRNILATPAKDRGDEQNLSLREYYLSKHNSEYSEVVRHVESLDSEIDAIRQRSPITHIQKEKTETPATAHILMRGAYDSPGELVHANTPESLHRFREEWPTNRLGLAQWLIDKNNPLTSRVTVNRFWQEVFGQGIVATTEDFGVMGGLPTHPELLDWLAVDFQSSNWDVQKFFKQMFMSATYRQSSLTPREKLEMDWDNALLSRGPRFRMDAEMVRDYALAVSDLLSHKKYGPGVKPYQPVDIWDIVGLPQSDTRNYQQDQGEGLYRRSLYSFWKRMAPPPNLEAFNAPSREVCTVRRERTNTPLQALVTLNDPQFVEAARCLASNALATSQGDDQVVQFMAERLLGRALQESELEIVLQAKSDYLDHFLENSDDATDLIQVGDSNPDARHAPPILATWTLVGNQMMNLDEALNK